jgi:hypothetical protein
MLLLPAGKLQQHRQVALQPCDAAVVLHFSHPGDVLFAVDVELPAEPAEWAWCVLWLAGKLGQHRQVALQPRDAMAVIMPPGGMPYLQHQVGLMNNDTEDSAVLS